MRFFQIISIGAPVLFLSGCVSERYANVNHEELVRAATAAAAEEAYQPLAAIETKDEGCVTTLRTVYIDKTKMKLTIDGSSCPELDANIATGGFLYTRHHYWEWRMQELVARKLSARPHGPESRPTALPPAPLPVFGEAPTPLKPVLPGL